MNKMENFILLKKDKNLSYRIWHVQIHLYSAFNYSKISFLFIREQLNFIDYVIALWHFVNN